MGHRELGHRPTYIQVTCKQTLICKQFTVTQSMFAIVSVNSVTGAEYHSQCRKYSARKLWLTLNVFVHSSIFANKSQDYAVTKSRISPLSTEHRISSQLWPRNPRKTYLQMLSTASTEPIKEIEAASMSRWWKAWHVTLPSRIRKPHGLDRDETMSVS